MEDLLELHVLCLLSIHRPADQPALDVLLDGDDVFVVGIANLARKYSESWAGDWLFDVLVKGGFYRKPAGDQSVVSVV